MLWHPFDMAYRLLAIFGLGFRARRYLECCESFWKFRSLEDVGASCGSSVALDAWRISTDRTAPPLHGTLNPGTPKPLKHKTPRPDIILSCSNFQPPKPLYPPHYMNIPRLKASLKTSVSPPNKKGHPFQTPKTLPKKPKTQNPKPKSQKPKPKTQNPKPETQNPRSARAGGPWARSSWSSPLAPHCGSPTSGRPQSLSVSGFLLAAVFGLGFEGLRVEG